METKMENFPKDVLFRLALELNLPELLKLCSTNSRINSLVCEKDDIWYAKLNADFPGYQMLKPNLRDNYRLLYELTILKEKLKIRENIYELYNLKVLDLAYNHTSVIPKEIGNLINLEDLTLINNRIQILPKEIGNLTNLKKLILNNNQIKVLPKEMANLTNLRYLLLYGNPLKEEISKDIHKIHNLIILSDPIKYKWWQ